MYSGLTTASIQTLPLHVINPLHAFNALPHMQLAKVFNRRKSAHHNRPATGETQAILDLSS
jgi:hypothetical protein